MLTTKDLIKALSAYPDGTEWEVIGDRILASELGSIDLEAMIGNDLSTRTYQDGRYEVTITDEQIRFNEKQNKFPFDRVGDWSEGILPEGERPKFEMNKTKAYIEAMQEGQRRTNEAAAPLAEFYGAAVHTRYREAQRKYNNLVSDIIQGEDK